MTLGSELLRFNKKQKYFLPDFETEGVNLFFSRPWQAAVVIFTLDEILETYNFYPWFDDLKVSDGAAKKTGFNFAHYKSKAIDPKIVCDKLDEYFYNPEYIPVYHNGLRFDSMIHQTLRRLCGKKRDYSYLKRSLDTDSVSRAYGNKLKLDNDNFLSSQYKMSGLIKKGVKSNLAAMGKEFKIVFDENVLHKAENDTLLNVEVCRNLIRKMEI